MGRRLTLITAHLPFPVSINDIWSRNRNGTMRLSDTYKAWQRQAGLEWLTQRQAQPKSISGPFKVYVTLWAPDKRLRDLDNFSFKAVLDFAQSMKLVENDHLSRVLYAHWGNQQQAPMGCRLVLRSHHPLWIDSSVT